MSVIPTWAEIRPRILQVMKEQGATDSSLHAATGISRTTIRDALSKAKDSQWGTATRILAALGLSLAWVQGEETWAVPKTPGGGSKSTKGTSTGADKNRSGGSSRPPARRTKTAGRSKSPSA